MSDIQKNSKNIFIFNFCSEVLIIFVFYKYLSLVIITCINLILVLYIF